MNTMIQKSAGLLAGFVVVLLCAAAFAPVASAQTYYYPVTYQTYGPYGSYNSTHNSPAEIQSLLAQLYTLMAQLQALQAKAGINYGHYTPTTYTPVKYTYSQTSYGSYDVEVETTDVDVDGDEATFSGEVDLDDADYADVWFIYGQDGDLDEETKDIRITRDDDFEIDVDDLDRGERYYVRAVAEDPSGQRSYGKILAFTAGRSGSGGGSDNDDIPDVTTEDAEDIDEDSAELHGRVDMNDFRNGIVFFVYGEDENDVEDVEDEDSYNDIDERGDDLQKVKVYSNLNGERSFWVSVFGLDDNTDHFFRICVEYEDEDDDDTLECGNVEEFTTDRD